MKATKSWITTISVVTLVIALLFVFWSVRNDLSDLRWLRSEPAIERAIRRQVPHGADCLDVERYLEAIDTKADSISLTNPLTNRDGDVIGVGHMMARLGSYRFPLTKVVVEVRFLLDEDCKVALVEVRKSRDTL